MRQRSGDCRGRPGAAWPRGTCRACKALPMAASLVLQLQELRTVIELLLDAVEERVGFFAGTRNRLLLDAPRRRVRDDHGSPEAVVVRQLSDDVDEMRMI